MNTTVVPIPNRALLVALACLLALGASSTMAQPFAAAGGFDRPVQLSRGQEREVAALTLDHGRPVLVHVQDDALLVHALPREAGQDPVLLDPGPQVRTVVASGGIDVPLVAIWSKRDLRTGRFHYHWTGGGELFNSVQAFDLVPVSTPSGPRVFVARGVSMAAVIDELGMDGQVDTLFRSEMRLVGLSATAVADRVQLTWLEGRTETTAFGSRDDWTAYAAGQDADGVWWGPVALGAASGGVPWTTTSVDGSGGVVRLFPGDDGLVRSHRSSGASADDLTADSRVLGPGRPAGSAASGSGSGADYLTLDSSLLRYPWDGGEVLSVAWSPLTVQESAVVVDANGHSWLSWTGTEVGGSYALYVSDDRQAMRPGLGDRLAASFGWSPWNLLQEAFGQLAASSLAAVLAAMAATPVLWLLALFLHNAPLSTARRRGALVGAVLPPAIVALVLAIGAPADRVLPLVGGLPTLMAATVIGGLAGWWLYRRRDMESLPGFLLASATAVGCSCGVVAFVSFQAWLQAALI